MKNVLDGLRDVVSNNYDGHLSIHECVSINNAISALYEWTSVFGFLGTADECGNEWVALKDENEQLRAKVAELEAKLTKYQNLKPVAYMCEEDPERESAFAWTHGICPGCGNYRIPLYALEMK